MTDVKCPKCGSYIDEKNLTKCPACGGRSIGAGKNVAGKYPALEFVSRLLKLTSFMIVFISFVSFAMIFENIPSYKINELFKVSIIPFILSMIIAIIIFSYGELITLFIDIEKNTRKKNEDFN